MLTGQCKIDFEEWVNENYTTQIARFGGDEINTATIILWEDTPLSIQWGVYQDFFDSVEDESEVRIIGKVSRGIDRYFLELESNKYAHKTRQEARTVAIEKANEIYNSK